MIYKRGKQGTYWIRFRFGGRFVHESTRTQKDQPEHWRGILAGLKVGVRAQITGGTP